MAGDKESSREDFEVQIRFLKESIGGHIQLVPRRNSRDGVDGDPPPPVGWER